MVIWKEVREALSKREAGRGGGRCQVSIPKAGNRRYHGSGWGSIACHLVWVTETGQEWKTGRRLGISHRQRAEKDNMATQPVHWVG